MSTAAPIQIRDRLALAVAVTVDMEGNVDASHDLTGLEQYSVQEIAIALACLDQQAQILGAEINSRLNGRLHHAVEAGKLAEAARRSA